MSQLLNKNLWLILMILTILAVYFLPWSVKFLNLRLVYYPIVLLFLGNILYTFFLNKDYSYLQFNRQSLKLNVVYFSPFALVLLILFLLKWYPQEDLSHLGRGIPDTAFLFFYSLISVPLQQILIFGELFNRLKSHFEPTTLTIILASFYSLMHIYYPQPALILIFTFIFVHLYFWYFVVNN